jgi:hypothetical protein
VVIERQAGMSELETAHQHLARALKRLETAVARRLMRPPSAAGTNYRQGLERPIEGDDLARDLDLLRSECDELSTALSDIQRDHRNLREVTSQVAQRIDGSIAEIDRLLEG